MSAENDQREDDVGPIKQSAMMSGDWVIFGFYRVPPPRRVADRKTLEAWECYVVEGGNPSEFVSAAINLRAAALDAQRNDATVRGRF